MRAAILLSIVTLSSTPLIAQVAPEFKKPKEVSPGVFEIGEVKLDQKAQTVSFPAKVNMVDGLVEYLMVTPEGSVHESILVCSVPPQDVHMAMLALGAKGMQQPAGDGAPKQIDAAFLAKAPKLTGDKVLLTVKWKDAAGAEQTVPVERWLAKRTPVPKQKPKETVAEDGPWIYNGSYFYENNFLAQSQGVFGSVVTFPSALINNPRTGSNDDHVWYVHTKAIPAKDTPVTFTIKLEPTK